MMNTPKNSKPTLSFQLAFSKLFSLFRQGVFICLLGLVMGIPVFSISGCTLPGQTPTDAEAPVVAEEEEAVDEEEAPEEGELQEEATEKEEQPPPVYDTLKDFHGSPLSWKTSEGLILQGTLYSPHAEAEHLTKVDTPPEVSDEDIEAEETEDEEQTPQAPPARIAPTLRYPLVILMHGLSGSSKKVEELVPLLVKTGYGVLALDIRGHGASTALNYGGYKSWRTFDQVGWDALPSDIGLIETYFKHPDLDPEKYPLEIKPNTLAIIAEGVSANAALIHSGNRDTTVKAIVSLGATLKTKGLSPVLPSMKSKVPTLFVSSKSDPVSFEDSQQLHRVAAAKKALRLYSDVGKGFDLLSTHTPARLDALRWIQLHMPSVGLPKPFSEAITEGEKWKASHSAKKKTPPVPNKAEQAHKPTSH